MSQAGRRTVYSSSSKGEWVAGFPHSLPLCLLCSLENNFLLEAEWAESLLPSFDFDVTFWSWLQFLFHDRVGSDFCSDLNVKQCGWKMSDLKWNFCLITVKSLASSRRLMKDANSKWNHVNTQKNTQKCLYSSHFSVALIIKTFIVQTKYCWSVADDRTKQLQLPERPSAQSDCFVTYHQRLYEIKRNYNNNLPFFLFCSFHNIQKRSKGVTGSQHENNF